MKDVVKRVVASLLLVMMIVLTVVPAFAEYGRYDHIRNIDVTVDLKKNGDAHVTEKWQTYVPGYWSELYIPKSEIRGTKIKNLKVTCLDTGEKYELFSGDWDTYDNTNYSSNEKRKMKAGKCGFHKIKDGKELCWGVGSEGEHTYEVSYDQTNFVREYKDGVDGFNVPLISDDLPDKPKEISITIQSDNMEFTKENTKLWPLGVEGNLKYKDGKIKFNSDSEKVRNVDCLNVLAQFESGIFDPSFKDLKKFKKVKKKFLEGSCYENSVLTKIEEGIEFFFSYILGALLNLLIAFFMVKAIANSNKFKRNNKIGGMPEKNEFRMDKWSENIPFKGNIPAIYAVIINMPYCGSKTVSGNVNSVMSAYLLRFIQKGFIRFEKGEKKREGKLILNKKVAMAEISSETERELYRMLLEAAGKDEILESREMKRWGRKHSKTVENWHEMIKAEGRKILVKSGYAENIENGSYAVALNDKGREDALNIMGFKNFLSDFAELHKEKTTDSNYWKDYLVIATLFSMAGQVAKEMEYLIPDYFEKPEKYGYTGDYYGGTTDIYMYTAISSMSRSINMRYNSRNGGGVDFNSRDNSAYSNDKVTVEK